MSSKLLRLANRRCDSSPVAAGGRSRDPAGAATRGRDSRRRSRKFASAELERQVEARAQAAYQQGQTAGEAAAGQRATQRMDPVFGGFDAADRRAGQYAPASSAKKRKRTPSNWQSPSRGGYCIGNSRRIRKRSWGW